jgi:hypothetical protein
MYKEYKKVIKRVKKVSNTVKIISIKYPKHFHLNI